MLVTFDKEYLKELYVSGKCSDKKHRFQPDVINDMRDVSIVWKRSIGKKII